MTGIGLVTPLGGDRESTWAGFLAGRSATCWLPEWWTTSDGVPAASHFAPSELPRIAGAPVSDAIAAHGFGKQRWPQDPVISLALIATIEAWNDASLDQTAADPERIGCVFGTSKAGVHSFAPAWARSHNGDAAGSSPTFTQDPWLACQPDIAARAVAAEFGSLGPVLCPVAACATGLVSLIRGADLIRQGVCDVVIAGSSDSALEPAVLASFWCMGVLARHVEDPTNACRPLDRSRCGFVVGEGAAAIVLESFDRVQQRQGTAYAEWLDGATLGGAAGVTRLGKDAAPLAELLRIVLRRSAVTPSQVDYVNLHGTGTRENDSYECAALRSAFGAGSTASCSSLKGGIGHLLGAAGSVEAAAAALALRDQLVPPTVNLRNVDPGCRLPDLPTQARERRVSRVVKISLGFGGHLAAGVLQQAPEALRRPAIREP